MKSPGATKIAAVAGHGRVWSKEWLAAFALAAAATAALAVWLAVAAAVTRWEYAIGAALAAAVSAWYGSLFVRGLLLARSVRGWLDGAVRLRVKTFVTGRTIAPAEVVMPGESSTPTLQLPVANPILVIRFRYGDVTVVKTTPCRGVYRRFASKLIEIYYSPEQDKVLLVAPDET